jgi:hypothetical protein
MDSSFNQSLRSFVSTPGINNFCGIIFQACNSGAIPNCDIENAEVDAVIFPPGHANIAERVGDRRLILAGYRLASQLERISGN